MKIAIWHNLPSGGGKRALHDQVRGLLARGHHIEIWCPPTVDFDYLPLAELAREHVVPLEVVIKPTKNLVKRATFAYHCVIDRLRAMQEHSRLCAQEIAAGEFDLLFAGSCSWYGAAMIGQYIEGTKVIYLQEPYRLFYEASDKSPWPALSDDFYGDWKSVSKAKRVLRDYTDTQATRVLAREELASARSYDEILVNSRFSRESILRAYNLNAQVCYLGINTEKFAPSGAARERFIVGVGAVAPHKNIEFVMRAVARITSSPLPLVWIGNVADAKYAAKMEALARELKVDLQLKVNISDAELVDTLNRAQIMAYAPHLEPFGYTPLEANACETPVVALAEGGIRETVQHEVNGLLVDYDESEMAAAFDQLLQDSALARQLGETGHRQVLDRWSLEQSIDRLEEKLRNAHQKHGRSGALRRKL